MAAYSAYLARSVLTLTIPQGYALTIAATFGAASHRFGAPGPAEAWTFAAGGVAAFVLLAALCRGPIQEPPPSLPQSPRITLNVVPVLSVLLGVAAAYVQPSPAIGFPLAGFVAVGGYLLLLAGFFRLVIVRDRWQAPG